MMRKLELEKRINEINEWLQDPSNESLADYRIKKHERDYLVNKLIELEEFEK